MHASPRVPTTALCLLALGTALRAAPPEPSAGAEASVFADGFERMFQGLGAFDWDAEAQRAAQAAEQLWKRNGWTDESDIFARDLACEVTKIPPWDVTARLNLFSQRLSERYGLSDEQSTRLQRSMIRETAALLAKNNRVLIEYGAEALAARAQGKPYTPQQVQRWAQAVDPLLADARASIDRMAQEIEPALSAEKKPVFQRDLSSVERRTRYVDEMSARWAQGKWTPEDWGLDKDPIQNGLLPAATIPSARPTDLAPDTLPQEVTARSIPDKWEAHDPPTWIAYVVHVQKRYGFDAGQRSAAESIHAELLIRATDYMKAHRADLNIVSRPDRSAHPAYEPVRTLFADLQARLDALPTTVQRESAGRP